ncbi:MAG: ATP synthase F1 subunit epsilon [Fimbriimonadaceae bacterium]|nr:ATP synthase F1 subunit epsilon [Fimbriimonadaceae bacterium]
MSSFTLSVVAPDRKVVETEVSSVIAPGSEGYLGVQRGHVPVIVSLKPGILEFKDTSNLNHSVVVDGGFMEVSGEQVIVIAEGAALANEIDLREAEQELDEARRALRGESSRLSLHEAAEAMDRAMNRIKAARQK